MFNANWVKQNTQGPGTILEDMKKTMLEKIQLGQNLDAALANYASARNLMKNEDDKTFWGAFQARLNDPYTWSYLVLPIKALAYPAAEVENGFEQLIAAANSVNSKVNKATYPFKSGGDFACAPPGTPQDQQPATCIVYNDGGKSFYIPVGLPLMLIGYDGIDSGVSKTNLSWWFATRGTSKSTSLPTPTALSISTITKVSAQVNWTEAGDALHYAYLALVNSSAELPLTQVKCKNKRCTGELINLKPNTKYVIRLSAQKENAQSVWSEEQSFKTVRRVGIDVGIYLTPSY